MISTCETCSPACFGTCRPRSSTLFASRPTVASERNQLAALCCKSHSPCSCSRSTVSWALYCPTNPDSCAASTQKIAVYTALSQENRLAQPSHYAKRKNPRFIPQVSSEHEPAFWRYSASYSAPCTRSSFVCDSESYPHFPLCQEFIFWPRNKAPANWSTRFALKSYPNQNPKQAAAPLDCF